MTEIPPLPGTWWAYYTDHAGRRAVLTIAVDGQHLLLTTAAGAQLTLTPTEAAMLLENLECATTQLL